uniref:C-type lectin domain-containing protein n=1 Tax=Erpetoichthys calabaricus TaxID=27687 RepID=A0A8C4RQ50_ERPCA
MRVIPSQTRRGQRALTLSLYLLQNSYWKSHLAPMTSFPVPVPIDVTSSSSPDDIKIGSSPMTAFPLLDFKIVILSHIMRQFHFELNDELNFEGGVKLCQEAGGQIATPASMEENKALTKLIKSDGMAYLDASGNPVKITNWAPGEPSNDQDDEDCSAITSDGTWSDNIPDTLTPSPYFLILLKIFNFAKG